MNELSIPPDCHPKIREIYEYWRGIHPAADRLPGRQDFSPFAVSHLLSNLWLVDVHRDPLRFRYRLIGTAVVARHDRDHTGRWLDEVHSSFASPDVQDQFRSAAEQGKIAWREGCPLFAYDHRDWLSIERIILPMASDGATVDMLLGLTIAAR